MEWFYKAWREACVNAGVPGLLYHDLRRTAVRNMLDAGIDEKTVMLIIGHKSRAMIDRYNIRNEKDVMNAGQQLQNLYLKKLEERKAPEKTVTFQARRGDSTR